MKKVTTSIYSCQINLTKMEYLLMKYVFFYYYRKLQVYGCFWETFYFLLLPFVLEWGDVLRLSADHRPLVSVLQIENNHHAAHGFFVFMYPYWKQAFNGLHKNKNPFRGGCFLLDRGAGGSRTRVQTWKSYAFYMLIPAWFSWPVSCRTT